jgi:hypothetical protein
MQEEGLLVLLSLDHGNGASRLTTSVFRQDWCELYLDIGLLFQVIDENMIKKTKNKKNKT